MGWAGSQMEVMVVMAILVCRLSLPSEPYFQGITVLLIGNWTLGHLLVEIKTVYPCTPNVDRKKRRDRRGPRAEKPRSFRI